MREGWDVASRVVAEGARSGMCVNVNVNVKEGIHPESGTGKVRLRIAI